MTVQRCIKAFGFRVPKNTALPFSSEAVTSVSPGDESFDEQLADHADAPVYIVGGGETGMDTAYTLIRGYPRREINFIVGRGTIFASRDESFSAAFVPAMTAPMPLQFSRNSNASALRTCPVRAVSTCSAYCRGPSTKR